MSLLGVYNINNLTECTKVLPASTATYSAPDQALLDIWLKSTKNIKEIAKALRNGDLLTALASLLVGLL